MTATSHLVDDPAISAAGAGDLQSSAPTAIPDIRCRTCGEPKPRRTARCPRCAVRLGGLSGRPVLDDPPAEQRPGQRRMVIHFRLYCFSCGRSTTVDNPVRRPGRCATCGGSMATEVEPD